VILAPVLGIALAAAPLEGTSARVRVGLETLETQGGGILRCRRVGLVCHAASVTADGRHVIDVLRAQDVELVRLFAPEHGLRTDGAPGAAVTDAADPATGLHSVSLCGSRTRPRAEDLAGLDVLVVDLQDAGVRFYTYVSTLIECLEASAEAGIELVVLDRPNPLGGERIEGPEAGADAPPSLLNRAPGPLIHGLTLGEMARLVNARLPRPGRVAVVPMAGWARAMTWADTRRPWVAPSPNLRSSGAALAYPGVCLLEATNVWEGRGTAAPFLLLGAPWIVPERLAPAVVASGYTLDSARFRPRASAAAPRPKYEGEACGGLRVRVADPAAAEPYRLGLGLLVALKRLYPDFAWREGGAAIDGLLGTRRLRQAIERGAGVEAILAQDAAGIARFRRERAGSLLY